MKIMMIISKVKIKLRKRQLLLRKLIISTNLSIEKTVMQTRSIQVETGLTVHHIILK
jgi:hypothetical protein